MGLLNSAFVKRGVKNKMDFYKSRILALLAINPKYNTLGGPHNSVLTPYSTKVGFA